MTEEKAQEKLKLGEKLKIKNVILVGITH